jgi:hypothetical protein
VHERDSALAAMASGEEHSDSCGRS